MATIRELITKLSTKADLSGIRQMIAGVNKAASASLKADKKTKDSTKRTAKFQTTKAIENMKQKVKLLQDTLVAEKRIGRQSMQFIKQKSKAELQLLKEVNREKLRQTKRMAKERARQQGRRGTSFGFPGGMRAGGGIGLGSIISGNVIANAITAGFRQAISTLKEFFAGIVGAAADIEKVQAEFGVMLSSGERAKELIADLKRVGAETPLQFKDLAKNARILLQYGSNVEDVIDQLIMLGDVVGGDRNRFDFMTFAFAQMQSAGKLMGQELRQMTNAGFNPLEQMAKKTGLTMIQLRKEMEMGTISSEDVTDAFRKATSQGGRFFKNMATQAKTFHGRVSTMRDEIFMMMEAMGTRLLPGMKNVVNTIINFVKGDGRQIGINLMDSILPAVNAIIAGMERFIRVLFDVDSIGNTLKNKDALTAFFTRMANKITDLSVWVTALFLQFKEFATEVGPAVAKGLGIILEAIKIAIRYLPELIKLWLGFKAIVIAGGLIGALGGIAGAIRGIVAALMMFATTNPLLFIALAALASIGIAAKRIFDAVDERKSHEERMKRAEDLNAQASKRIKLLNAQIQAEENLRKKLEDTSLTDSQRARLQERLDRASVKKTQIAGEVKSLSQAAVEAMTGRKENTLLGDLKGFISGLSDIKGPSLDFGTSFDKKLEEIRKTKVTQNFFNTVTVQTDITNQVPEGTNGTSMAEEMGAQVRRYFGRSLDEALIKSVKASMAS